MAYEQTLYSIDKDWIKPAVIKKKNRYAKWEYGYDSDHDVVVISKTGKIGEIYEMSGIRIALPKEEGEAKNLGDAGGDFIHTNNFVLIDPQKRIRGYYDGTNPDEVDELITDIGILKAE